MEEQPADLMTCHHGVKDAMKDKFYQTLDADAVLRSFQITQTTKNAMAKILELGLPPTSLEVVKKVVVVIALKFKGIFSQEIIKEGYEVAGYPGFDVAQALKKNSSFNKLSKDHQEKLKMMVVQEFPKEFLTPKRELYDSTILAALKRENIEVEEGGLFPLQGQEDLPIKERRAIPFADASFRATIQKRVQEKANRAEIAKKVKAEKKEDRKRVKEDADGKNEAKKAKVAPDNVPAAAELLPGHVPAASVEAILPGHPPPLPLEGSPLLLPLSSRTGASGPSPVSLGLPKKKKTKCLSCGRNELDTVGWSKCSFFGPRKCMWNVCGVQACQTALLDHGKGCCYKPKVLTVGVAA